MSCNPLHSAQTVADGIHIPYAFQYTDESARTSATGFVSGDVGKFARQTDNNSIWMLTSTAPTWILVGGSGTIGSDVNELREAIQTILKELDGYHPDITGTEHYNQHSETLQEILGAIDGYGSSEDLQGYVNTELEHTIQSSEIFQTILKDLDGYASDSTVSEHYNQHSQVIQTILKELDGYETDGNLDERVTTIQISLDGYASNQTVSEHYQQHNETIQIILGTLDGYHPDITGQEHYRQHSQAIQDIISVLDGYEEDTDISGLTQTVSEHYSQHSNAIQAILSGLDGYHPDITGQEHYNQHSQAIQTILKDLDGYVTAAGTDIKVKVSSNDTTTGYLSEKLSSGTGITLTENNDGSNENLEISLIPASSYAPAVQVSREETYSVSTSFTDVVFDHTDVEIDPTVIKHHDANTERIYVYADGYYAITYTGSFDLRKEGSSFNSVVTGQVYLNDADGYIYGSQTDAGQHYSFSLSSSEDLHLSHSFITYLLSGDYVTLQFQKVDVSGPGDVTLNKPTVFTVRSLLSSGQQGVPGPTGSGSNILIKDEDGYISGGPHSVLNFTGDGVTVTDGGDGQAEISIPRSARTDNYMFSSEADRFIKGNTTYPTWEVIGTFIFRGTTAMGTPTYIKVISDTADPAKYHDLRVYDVTNGNDICSLLDQSGTATIRDLGTLSNLPSDEAMWEMQARKSQTDGNDGRVYSLHIYY